MMWTLAAACLVSVIAPERSHSQTCVGDTVFIEMSGALAWEYTKRVNSHPSLLDRRLEIEVSTVAKVTRQLNDGRIRLEHTRSNDSKEKKGLITMTIDVDPNQLTTERISEDATVNASPQARKVAKPTKKRSEPAESTRLKISDFKGVTLRVWTLAEEIGAQ